MILPPSFPTFPFPRTIRYPTFLSPCPPLISLPSHLLLPYIHPNLPPLLLPVPLYPPYFWHPFLSPLLLLLPLHPSYFCPSPSTFNPSPQSISSFYIPSLSLCPTYLISAIASLLNCFPYSSYPIRSSLLLFLFSLIPPLPRGYSLK